MRQVLLALAFIPMLMSGGYVAKTLAQTTVETPTNDLDRQRALYAEVNRNLDSGSSRLFEQHRAELRSYPLYPYLQYKQLTQRLLLTDRAAVDAYLEHHANTWLGKSLRRSWLQVLYQHREWQLYQHYVDLASVTTEIDCHYQFARYQTGDKQSALKEALRLWTVEKSQPRACDALFQLLISNQRITEDIAWQRYTKAVTAHQFALAKYIERFFRSSTYQRAAQDYVDADRKPRRIKDYQRYAAQTPEYVAIIEHAIRHLARHDAILARQHWERYQQTHTFDVAAQGRVLQGIVKGLHNQGHEDTARDYLYKRRAQATSGLLEWQLRLSLHRLDWPELLNWLEALPPEITDQQRWRYWRARALLLQSSDPQVIDSAKTTLRELSRFRSFYGFMASDMVGNPYRLQHRPITVATADTQALYQLPGIRRAREFLFHQNYYRARRDWYNAAQDFRPEQWVVAAHIARQWQWHRQTIIAMTKAAYWDDIDIRFPLAYQDTFARHGKNNNLPLPLVMAIARQESALSPVITSPAGARGLMQLMPATARETARKHRIAYRSATQLFDPDVNIELGTRYYRDMLERFQNNRILASAAYNAGPHRVNRWLKASAGKLPFDVWIETIPFSETRQYVQNVLSFGIIYGHHLNTPQLLLSSAERTRLL